MFNYKILSLLTLLGFNCFAGVFNDGVRFFDEGKQIQKSNPENLQVEKKAKSFSWNDQLNIENDQFFKEGDYMPPAPLVEALRRPTKENIQNYEKWQEMRNILLQRYEIARSQHLGKSSVSFR